MSEGRTHIINVTVNGSEYAMLVRRATGIMHLPAIVVGVCASAIRANMSRAAKITINERGR
jgi:hypothetical protein